MALLYMRRAVNLLGLRAGLYLARIGAETRRAADAGDVFLFFIRWMTGCVVLSSISRLFASAKPRTLRANSNDCNLHSKAEAEVGHAVLARVPRGDYLAFDAALSEAAGNEYRVGLSEYLGDVPGLKVFRFDGEDVDLDAVRYAGVQDGLVDAEVGVLYLGVLPTRATVSASLRVSYLCRNSFQSFMSGEPFVGRPSFLRTRWSNFCECSTIGILYIVSESYGFEYGIRGDAAEKPYLLAKLRADRVLRTADYHVGLDAYPAQLVDAVLCRLRLELSRRSDVGNERDVAVKNVGTPDAARELAYRLEVGADLRCLRTVPPISAMTMSLSLPTRSILS